MVVRGSAASPAFLSAGFAILRGFLRPSELPTARAEVERLLAAPLPVGCERPHNTLVPLRWNARLVDLVLSSPARIEGLARVVRATDLRWISGYVSVKEPHSGALWWHQDWWCWDHPVTYRRETSQVAVLCYLTDTDETNGALRVLPGTHRRSVPLHAALPAAHGQEANALDERHAAMRDLPDQVTVTARAGDAVVLDYRLLHGTHPNRSHARRDGVLLTLVPHWRHLPSEIRGHLIRHPAQPGGAEQRTPRNGWTRPLLPRFHGPRRDLPLNRVAPARFVADG